MTSSSREPGAPDARPPASLAEQLGRTKASFSRLFSAHVGLLKAEIGEIVNQIKVLGTLAGAALGVALLVGHMLYIGGLLFVGEWLFGSIGWGFAHGVLLGAGIVVSLILAILGARGGSLVLSFVLAILAMVGMALLVGSNVAYDAASATAGQLGAPLSSPGVVALIAGAIVGALLFALLFLRIGGAGGAVAGFVVGALLGMPLGWLVAGAPWTWPPAVGFAITIGLLLWPLLAVVLAWPSLDPGARFARLYPRQSMDAVNETKAWLEEQWQTRRPKLGKS